MKNRSSLRWIKFLLIIAVVPTCPSGSKLPEDLPSDGDGSGSDDDEFSDLFSDDNTHGVIVRCYKCTGDIAGSWCNVTDLRQNPEAYFTDCNGHCINLTIGHNTIFDCTEKVAVKRSQCFHRDETDMCVCGTDLCNGPLHTRSQVMDLPSSQDGIQLLSEHEVQVQWPRTLTQQADRNGEWGDGSNGSSAGQNSQSNGSSRLLQDAKNGAGSNAMFLLAGSGGAGGLVIFFFLVKLWWYCNLVWRGFLL